MGGLTEIRIDGRGGQGNIVAAYMLARAAFNAGLFSQAFPNFGPERRGAPVAGFVRLSDRPIRRRCQVSAPLYIIIQDPSLLHVPALLSRVIPGGGILINSPKTAEQLELSQAATKVVTIPATSLAVQFLGEPIPNVALLSAFLALTELVPLSALEKVLAARSDGETLDRNLRLMREAGARVAGGSWKDMRGADCS